MNTCSMEEIVGVIAYLLTYFSDLSEQYILLVL